MATDKLINSTQGDDIIGALNDIADNVGNITYGPQTSADKVVSMLGYAEAAEAASINPGDTLNVAIGKLEKKANDNATDVANKIDKLTNATAGDIATVTATGEIADSTVSIADSNTGLADSDAAVPTSKTVKTYVDSTATGISRYLGTITAANQLSTSAKKGDFYVVKTAWTGVHAGDEIIAEKDGPAQTIDGTNWSLLHNEADTDTKYQFGEGTSNGTFLVTPSDTGVAQSVPIKGLGSAAYTTADTSSLTNDNNHVPTSALAKSLLDAKVPTTRKVNNKALSSDITLSASDVSAVPSSNVTTTLPASSAAASTSKVMSEKLVYDNYVQNSDLIGIVDNGAKNIIDWTNPNTAYQEGTGIVYTNNSDGSWTVTGTKGSTTNCRNIMVCIQGNPITEQMDSNTDYVLQYNAAGTGDCHIDIYGMTDTYNKLSLTSVGNNGFAFNSGNYTDWLMRLVVDGNSGATINFSLTIMLTTKSQYNISPTYEPYALGNQVLTPELIELCDSGAKNLFDVPSSATIDTITWTADSDSYITASPNNTDTRGWGYNPSQYKFNLKAGTYVCVLDIKTASSQSGLGLAMYSSSGTNIFSSAISQIQNKTGMVTWKFTISAAGSYGIEFKCYNMIARIMICTKAAFGVSSKFVPYRPNYDLVVSKLPVVKYVNYTITTADSWEEIEALRFTVPTGKIVSIVVAQTFSSTKPLGVEVCVENNSDKIKSVVHFEDTSSYTALSASGVYNNTSGAPKTLYVFVRAQGTGTNTVTLCYQICN